jgi:hypothetical protein
VIITVICDAPQFILGSITAHGRNQEQMNALTAEKNQALEMHPGSSGSQTRWFRVKQACLFPLLFNWVKPMHLCKYFCWRFHSFIMSFRFLDDDPT